MSFIENLEKILEKKEEKKTPKPKKKRKKTTAVIEKKIKPEKIINEREVLKPPMVKEIKVAHAKTKKMAEQGVSNEAIRFIHWLLYGKTHRGRTEETIDRIIKRLEDIKRELTA